MAEAERLTTPSAASGMQELRLRYGVNPYQTEARIIPREGDRLPLTVLNGAPGYINLLDALNSWQLVRELRAATGQPAATSFKHVSPAGAAVASPLDDVTRQVYFVADMELSPLATAYARARGADRLSSFGDWVGLSDVVDASTAGLLRREASDGVIAPGYEPEALSILRGKQGGRFVVLEIDPAFQPAPLEDRDVFGVRFQQVRNNSLISEDVLKRVVTARSEVPAEARRDMIVASIALKYTQSNSMALALDGQTIGIGAGQQSRIHCTRLAAAKADTWWLRHHPAVLSLPFKRGLSRTARTNAIDGFLRRDLTAAEETLWQASFEAAPQRLSFEDEKQWLSRLHGVVLASDAFIPFRDNVDRAAASGVEYVVQPGGSQRDDEVIQACDEYGMAMVFTGLRLFHH